jgi:hypothetical protein
MRPTTRTATATGTEPEVCDCGQDLVDANRVHCPRCGCARA